jgi:translation initiation factor 3 subunit K
MPALYDPAGLPALEAKVHAQCKDGSYDLDNNLAVLKLYQFHPEKNNSAIVARILVKALMHLPETDYLMCTYLIPEAVVRSSPTLPMADISAAAAAYQPCLWLI